jgi:hypothetical protein
LIDPFSGLQPWFPDLLGEIPEKIAGIRYTEGEYE